MDGDGFENLTSSNPFPYVIVIAIVIVIGLSTVLTLAFHFPRKGYAMNTPFFNPEKLQVCQDSIAFISWGAGRRAAIPPGSRHATRCCSW